MCRLGASVFFFRDRTPVSERRVTYFKDDTATAFFFIFRNDLEFTNKCHCTRNFEDASTSRATELQSISDVHVVPASASLRIHLTPTGIDSKSQIRPGGRRNSVARLFTATGTEGDEGPHPHHPHIVHGNGKGKGNGDDGIALRRRVIAILDLSLTIDEAPPPR